jgi:hypothetical protein
MFNGEKNTNFAFGNTGGALAVFSFDGCKPELII